MAIPVIVVAAAKALVVAIATRVGEKIGDMISAAMSGTTAVDDINRRLDAIEQKLDQLIDFISKELPELMYVTAWTALYNHDVNAIRGKFATVLAGMTSFAITKSDGDATILKLAANDIQATAEALVPNGPAALTPCALAFHATASGYFLLHDHQKDQKAREAAKQTLKLHASLILPSARSWIAPSVPGSIASVLLNKQSQLKNAEVAKENIDAMKGGKFLFAVIGPELIGSVYTGVSGWFTGSSMQNGKVAWEGDWNVETQVSSAEGPPVPSKFGCPVPPWVPNIWQPAGTNIYSLWARVRVAASDAATTVNDYPAQIAELNQLLKEGKAFVEFLESIVYHW